MQVSKTNANLGIGAGAGAVVGAGAGLLKGMNGLKKLGTVENFVDAYVSSRQSEALERLMDKGFSVKNLSKAMKKVAQKAKMDCPVDDFNNLLENAKKTKNKWIAIGAGVGLALGAVAAKVISSANANKE